nr:hypothetical protein [uncultured Marvinbryantia sp.]
MGGFFAWIMSRAETIWRYLAADENACVLVGIADIGRNACISDRYLLCPPEWKYSGSGKIMLREVSVRRISRQRAEELCGPEERDIYQADTGEK